MSGKILVDESKTLGNDSLAEEIVPSLKIDFNEKNGIQAEKKLSVSLRRTCTLKTENKMKIDDLSGKLKNNLNSILISKDLDAVDISIKQKHNKVNIKDFKIMLVNGVSKVGKEVCIPLKKTEKFLMKSDADSTNAPAADVDDDNAENEMDDKCSIDENSFELRIENDDDEECKNDFNSLSSFDSPDTNSNKVFMKNDTDDKNARIVVQNSDELLSDSLTLTETSNVTDDNISDDSYELSVTTMMASPPPPPSSSATTGNQKMFTCVFCDKPFPRKDDLKSHIVGHLKTQQKENNNSLTVNDEEVVECVSKKSVYSCILCSKSFDNKSSLIAHYKVHTLDLAESPSTVVQQPLSATSTLNGACVSDGTASRSGAATVEDGASVEIEDTKQYKCYICDKQFARNSSLMWHIQFHETYMYTKLKKTSQMSEMENGLMPGSGGDSLPTDTDRHRCQICGKSFETFPGFKRHMSFHAPPTNEPNTPVNADSTTSAGEKCELCDKYCTTAAGLKRHIISMHKDQSPALTMDDDELDCDKEEEFPCTLCAKVFTLRGSLRRHLNLVHNGETLGDTHSFRCDSCGKYFSTSSNLRKHTLKHCHGPVVADPEEDSTADEAGPEEFRCQFCGRIFSSKRARSIHCSSQHRVDDDNESVASVPSVESTESCSYFETEDGLFQCNMCQKTFDSRKGAGRHIGYHKSDSLFGSSGRTLKGRAGASDAQVNTDDDEEDEDEPSAADEDGIKCPICDKTFESVRGMRIHANCHREQKSETAKEDDGDDDDNDEESYPSSYPCDICGESFKTFRSFKVHTGWHSRRYEVKEPSSKDVDLLPYQCRHCRRTFPHQQALAGHMNAHLTARGSGVELDEPKSATPAPAASPSKKFVCRVCGMQFVSGNSLGGHMNKHNNNNNSAAQAVVENVSQTDDNSLADDVSLESDNDETMECDACGKFFMRKQDLAKHIRDHLTGSITKENVDLSLFRCIHCSKSFVGRKSLSTHLIWHEEHPNASLTAQKRRASQSLAVATPAKRPHLTSSSVETRSSADVVACEDGTSQNRCEECDRSLASKQSLRRHMEWHARNATDETVDQEPVPEQPSIEMPFECLYCDKRFVCKELLVEHTSIHEASPAVNDLSTTLGEHAVVQCSDGNEEYFIFDQHEGEAFQCSECDETHYDKLQMIVHMSYHVGKRWANGHQKSLMIRANPAILAPYKCVFCDERFVNKSFRSRHVLKRHRDDVLQCNSCKKLFLSKTKLEVHCRLHVADAMYRCEHCLKCFTSKWFLKRHARKKCVGKTSPEKKVSTNADHSPSLHAFDHKCDFCGMLFSDRDALVSHLQSHVLKYKCENCDFGCENILDLESHACIVTTETVICSECDDAFLDTSELEAHRLTRHSGSFLCDCCSEFFTSEDDLRHHKRTNHSSDKDDG